MGSLIDAVIQHNLSSKEVLSLSELLNDDIFLDKKGHKLKWSTPHVSTTYLEKYWRKTPEDFIKGPWEIDPYLENEKLDVWFLNNNLASLNMYIRPSAYEKYPSLKSEFDLLAKSIALQMKAVDIIIIEDWYYDHAFTFNDKTTVEIIRQGVKSMNLPFYEIDLYT